MKKDEFITADTHFGHSNILKHAGRPFESVEEMDEALISRWNAKIPKRARIYHLGDFAWSRKDRILEILSRLNGRIFLLRGNHDRRNIKGDLASRFDEIRDYYESWTEDRTKVIMSHYAHLVWNMNHYGSWMLYGHSHDRLLPTNLRRIDVGVDAHPNYEPFSFWEIAQRMEGRTHVAVDHHVADDEDEDEDDED